MKGSWLGYFPSTEAMIRCLAESATMDKLMNAEEWLDFWKGKLSSACEHLVSVGLKYVLKHFVSVGFAITLLTDPDLGPYVAKALLGTKLDEDEGVQEYAYPGVTCADFHSAMVKAWNDLPDANGKALRAAYGLEDGEVVEDLKKLSTSSHQCGGYGKEASLDKWWEEWAERYKALATVLLYNFAHVPVVSTSIEVGFSIVNNQSSGGNESTSSIAKNVLHFTNVKSDFCRMVSSVAKNRLHSTEDILLYLFYTYRKFLDVIKYGKTLPLELRTRWLNGKKMKEVRDGSNSTETDLNKSLCGKRDFVDEDYLQLSVQALGNAYVNGNWVFPAEEDTHDMILIRRMHKRGMVEYLVEHASYTCDSLKNVPRITPTDRREGEVPTLASILREFWKDNQTAPRPDIAELKERKKRKVTVSGTSEK